MNSSITTIEYNNKKIYLIATAHVSHISANEVKETIENIKPDSVCIELDADRYESLQNPKKWENTDIYDVIKQKKSGYMLANLILSSYQKKIAAKVDIKAGQEMIQAIESAKEIDANITLADRSIPTTFTRIYRNLSFFEKIKLISLLISSIFSDEDIKEEDIEELKQSDMLEASLKEVYKSFPNVAKVLIDERDQTLAYNIKNAPGDTIVAVVGAAHVPGIKKEIFLEQDIKELTKVPPKKSYAKLIGWLIPLIIIILILSLFSIDPSLGLNQLLRWTLLNGTLSAIGVLLAKGHIISIITVFVAAPITSLNPLLAAGWFAGLSEAFLRKPKVKDFQNIAEDTSSFKGFYNNRVTHILIVVALANLFSTIGTLIGGVDLISAFFNAI
ncbi:MAG: TraB/GumN family protein [Anaerorhabdus sp.]